MAQLITLAPNANDNAHEYGLAYMAGYPNETPFEFPVLARATTARLSTESAWCGNCPGESLLWYRLKGEARHSGQLYEIGRAQ